MAGLPPARSGTNQSGGDDGEDDAAGGPYARSWRAYLEAGWHPLPVVGKAGNLPPGFTGEQGKGVTESVAAAWATARGVDNVGLRLPVGVVGIDVDDYSGKGGRETLLALAGRYGALPETWSSTARGDGWSRQLLYRTPPASAVRLPGVLGPGVEVIQHHHRFTVAWPSVHPDTKTVYTWYRPDGTESDRPPRVDELTRLPEPWHEVAAGGGAPGKPGGGKSAYTNPDVDRLLRHGVQPEDGLQNEVLRDLVWKLVGAGLSDAQVELQWQAVVARTPLTRPNDPWLPEHFREQLRGARAKLGAGTPVTPGQIGWARGVEGERAATASSTVPVVAGAEPAGVDGRVPPGGVAASERLSPLAAGEVWALLVPEDGYRVPEEYAVDRNGVTVKVVRNKGRKNEDTVWETVAVRPFAIRRRYRDDRGETRYELAWLTDDEVVRSRVVTAEDVRNGNRLVEAFPDVVVTGVTASRAVSYASELLRVNREWLVARGESVATALGWPLDRNDATVFTRGPGAPRRVDDVKNTGAWLAGHESRGSLAAWKKTVWEAADRPLVLAMVAGGLAAPLLRLLGAANFAVDLSGPTSGGKTTALAVAASAWGDPARVLVSWKNTRVAVEHHLSMVRGMPLCLNESQLADVSMVEDVVYSLTEGHSKGRSRQDGSGLLDGAAWETVLLATGEQPLTAVTKKGGIVPRVVTLTGQPCRDKAQADALLLGTRESYGLAGEPYLERLAALGEAALRERYAAWRAWLASTGDGEPLTPVAGRRADSVAVMATAARVAEELGLLPPVAGETWRWLVAGGDAGFDDEDDRALAALRDVLAWAVANAGRFYGHPNEVTFLGSPPGGWLGRWEAGAYVSFDPATLRKKLVDLGYDQGRVLTDWRDRGWLKHSAGKNTQPVRLGAAGSARHVMVTRLEDLAEGSEEPGVTGGRRGWAEKVRDGLV